MMKILLIILSFFIFNVSLGQKLVLKGIVRNATDSSGLGFANIYIRNTGIGIYTNEVGEFELHFPDLALNDTLIVSYLGFKSYEAPLKNIYKEKANVAILLYSVPIKLPDVEVKKDTSYKIINKAFSLIKKNYPNKQFYLDGFYRELSLKDERYTRLIEAAIGIQDYGFDAHPERRKVQVLELRKSDDYIERSWVSKTITLLFGKTNALDVSLRLGDYLRRYRTDPLFNPVDKKPFNEYYEFRLNRLDTYDMEKVFVVDIFLPASRDKGQFAGQIIINQKDYAILHIEWLWGAPIDFKSSTDSRKRMLVKAYFNKYEVDYRRVGDKYYLSKLISIFPINFDAINVELGQGMQYYNCFYITNNVYTKHSEFNRIRRRDALRSDMDLYEEDFTYNENFWRTYNTLLINPLLKKVVSDLEKEKSLERQFKRN